MKNSIPASVLPWIHGVTQHPVGKKGMWLTRRLAIGSAAFFRSSAWLRRRLHLPSNVGLDLRQLPPTAGVQVYSLDDNVSELRRNLPVLPDNAAIHAYFGSRCQSYSEKQYVAALEGGSVWGCAQGAVFTRAGDFVPLLSRDPWGPQLHEVWTRIRLPRAQRLAGRVLNLVTAEAADNYHHWLIDLLPRAGLAERCGFPIESFDWILLNDADRPYQRETLATLGVDPRRLIRINPTQRFQADQLVVPSLKQNNEQISEADAAFLRRLFLSSAPSPQGRRIFLSRRDAKTRRLKNESEIAALLSSHGFEQVFVSKLTVAEQARLFAESEAIAGPSGAAFANLVFAQPGTQVIELASPNWLTAYHWMISARLGLAHAVVMSGNVAPPSVLNISGRFSDFSILPGDVVHALQKLKIVSLGERLARMPPLPGDIVNEKVTLPTGVPAESKAF